MGFITSAKGHGECVVGEISPCALTGRVNQLGREDAEREISPKNAVVRKSLGALDGGRTLFFLARRTGIEPAIFHFITVNALPLSHLRGGMCESRGSWHTRFGTWQFQF